MAAEPSTRRRRASITGSGPVPPVGIDIRVIVFDGSADQSRRRGMGGQTEAEIRSGIAHGADQWRPTPVPEVNRRIAFRPFKLAFHLNVRLYNVRRLADLTFDISFSVGGNFASAQRHLSASDSLSRRR